VGVGRGTGALGMRRLDVDMMPHGRHFSGDESFIEDTGREGTEGEMARREGGVSQDGQGAKTKGGSVSKL